MVEYSLDSTGTWSSTYTASTTEGSRVVYVRQTDAAGNVSPSQTIGFTLDTTAPAAPTSVSIASNNVSKPDTTKAIVGDTVTLSFTLDGTESGLPTVTIGGSSAVVTLVSGSSYTATHVVTSSDTAGVLAFTIDAKDAAGNAMTQTTATTDSTSVTYSTSDPLVLDLNGDGIYLTASNAGTLFDMDGDTIPDATGWTGPQDGLLVLDQNGDGRIESIREVVSEWMATGVTGSSLVALATLDTSKNGQIDAGDDQFDQLQVWVDQNQDGISASQELYTLSQLGIVALGLVEDTSGAMVINGSLVTGFATVDYIDGHQGSMAVVEFAFTKASQEGTESSVATATLGNDILTATVGDNVLAGNAGSDVLQGGAGDDILFWDGADLLIDGGHGNDTLKLQGMGQSLDLTALSNDILQGIEKVDLSSNGDNVLSLDISDLLDLSDSSDQLMVSGDEGDELHVTHAEQWALSANSTVLVDGISLATDASGHATVGADSFAVYQNV